MMTIEDFLFDLPLYREVSEEERSDLIIQFLTKEPFHDHEVNGYNPIEKFDSTFTLYSGINTSIRNNLSRMYLEVDYVSDKTKKFETHEIIMQCKRYGTFLHFLVRIEERDFKTYVSKVGQYPSVADYHIGQVHKYDKVIPRDKMREFTKSIGLAANGVGIGSFVYLRRIFEHLVFEAHEVAKSKNPAFDEAAFASARMNEKIQMLSGYLPDYLVEHHAIYGILSKGIHELGEEECKKYFPILKVSIELILDEKLETYLKEKHKKEIGNALSQIAGEIK